MPTNKGFTLIELAVVLAIIAILAAVLTPMVTGYIDQARETRRQGDVRAIATSILNYQRDTSRFSVFLNASDANDDMVYRDSLFGPGNYPTLSDAGWIAASSNGLEDFLNTNNLNLPTSARGGRVSYCGPYLDLGAVPWG